MSKEDLFTVVFVYSGDFAERVIRNLINDPSFCKSCGLYCDHCKYGVYSHVHNIRAAIKLPNTLELPPFIDEPEKYMPKKIPWADLCIASGLHKDLLLEMPSTIKKFGVKGLIVPFPKPFCSLEHEKEKPTISRFVTELDVGLPELEISTIRRGNSEVIGSVIVRRSAPCGSTWYVAKKIMGVETRREILYDAIAKAHHSYPCTATMNMDPEIKEPILHVGGYIIREAVEKALGRRRKKRFH